LQEPVRVGIEGTGPIHWFERLLAELGHELWIGDSGKIRASEVRKQKTDERDAALILDLPGERSLELPRARNCFQVKFDRTERHYGFHSRCRARPMDNVLSRVTTEYAP
jgi:hypothetical protein